MLSWDSLTSEQRRIVGLWAAAVLIVLAVTGAWAVERVSAAKTVASGGGYSVSVVRGNRILKTFTAAELEALGTRRVKMQGKWQTGPPVQRVLDAAGVDGYSALTFSGSEGGVKQKLTLQRSEISNDVLLDIAFRGTAKLCGPNIAQTARVRDLTRIEVQR